MAGCGCVGAVELHARSLGPLVKARAFGMTQQRWGRARNAEGAEKARNAEHAEKSKERRERGESKGRRGRCTRDPSARW